MTPGILDRLAFSHLNYWIGFALDTTASLALLGVGFATTDHPWHVALGALGLGVVVFTLYEYALHRWLYHVLPTAVRRIHARHHADTRLIIGAPFFFSLGITAVTWAAARLALGDATGAVFAGTILAAYAYHGAVHHLIHMRWFSDGGWFGRLQRDHLLHHRRGRSNFGVTTTVWDRVFRTYAG